MKTIILLMMVVVVGTACVQDTSQVLGKPQYPAALLNRKIEIPAEEINGKICISKDKINELTDYNRDLTEWIRENSQSEK